MLDLEAVETKASLWLFASKFAQQPILLDTHIKGLLSLSESEIPGLTADRLVCDSNLFLAGKFKATAKVRLLGAKIGGDFYCRGGTFENILGAALSADGIAIGRDLNLDDGFNAHGEVRFHTATIGGDFLCAGGSFKNDAGIAFNADGVNIRRNLNLDDGFVSHGEVRLVGATIGGNLSCRRASIKNGVSHALVGDRLKVGGNLYLDEGFVAQGEVRLSGAAVGGDLLCSRGYFENPAGYALQLQTMTVDGVLFFDSIKACAGIVDLSSASVHSLKDDFDAWPPRLVLDGFRYDDFVGGSTTKANARLGWLDKQPVGHSGRNGIGENFRPQPWLQLHKALGGLGHYEAAREVGIAFEARKRHCGLIGGTPDAQPGWFPTWSRLAWLWPFLRKLYRLAAVQLHKAYGLLVDYGYRPLKLVFWALLVWGVCAGAFFYVSRYEGVFVPTQAMLYQKHDKVCGPPEHVRWTDCKAIQAEYPLFYPAVYSLNVLLPVGNLGQEAAWRPLTTRWPGIFTQLAVWFETLFGWVASLILVAVVSGLAKKDE